MVYFNSTTVPPHRIRYNANVVMPFGKGKKFGSGWNRAGGRYSGRLADRGQRRLAQRLLDEPQHMPCTLSATRASAKTRG